jgi:predicted Rossmann fold nucleotide-binding protein DprA/Smf involved in DNA uptake
VLAALGLEPKRAVPPPLSAAAASLHALLAEEAAGTDELVRR